MLHELLLALRGHPGHIFYKDESDSSFKVNSSIPLLHPSEVKVIESLLEVGAEYAKLQEFIRTHRNTENIRRLNQGNFKLHGLYIEAVCHGLKQVLLPYDETLLQLEADILSDGNFLLSQIQHRIMNFLPLLMGLNHVIRRMQLFKAHGCFILDFIYKASCSGVEQIQIAMKRLLQEAHKVLYKQLLSWILQGKLFDPYDEFFIGQVEKENFTAEDSTNTFISETSIQIKPRIRHQLKSAMVPTHISLDLAEKIFFIGESIQLFESDHKLELQGQVLKDRDTEFYEKLAKLRDEPEFQAVKFEKFVESVRASTSQHLLQLVLEKSNLRKELEVVRNFFLLARGELFQTFIKNVDRFLRKPVASTTAHDVNQGFATSCRSILAEDDKDVKRVKFRIFPSSSANESHGQDKSPQAWKCLGINYSVPWPLHLIFSETTLTSYNRVFRFLLMVKRAQMALHEAWADRKMSLRGRYHHENSHDHGNVAELRMTMTFVVDNLQQYFMADVLESQFSTLMSKIEKAENFEDLKSSHDFYLTEIVTLTFINNKPVHQCINEMLSACLHFTNILETFPSPEDFDDQTRQNISYLRLSFGRHSALLFQILSSLRSHHTGTHLAQLLLRIDYNRFFSSHGYDIGKIAK